MEFRFDLPFYILLYILALKVSSQNVVFYIYFLEDQEKLSVLTAELLEYCNAQKSRSPYIPKIGDACCAKYTSKILSLTQKSVHLKHETYNFKKYLIFYILYMTIGSSVSLSFLPSRNVS